MRVTMLVIVIALVVPSSSSGQPAVIAIEADRIIDGTGAPPIVDGVVVVRGSVIEAVGPSASVEVPQGAARIELPGETVLPGLIDGHNHLSIRYGISLDEGEPKLGNPGMMEQMMQHDAIQTLRMVRHARSALLCGVTTLRVTGEAHFNDVHLRDAIREGTVIGPRLFVSGVGLLTSAEPDTESRWVDDPSGLHMVPLVNWLAVQKVRRNFEQGAEWIKVSLYGQTSEASSFSLGELSAIVAEAHRLGMKVAAHATGRWGRSMKTAIRAGVDTIEHARPMTDEVIEMMVEQGTAVVFTPLVYVGFRPDESTWGFMDNGVRSPGEWIDFQRRQYFDYRRTHPEVETEDRPYDDHDEHRRGRDFSPSIRTQQSQALAAHRAGVPLSLGMDPLYVGGVGNAIEFLVEAGFSPMEAIRAGTAMGAQNLGIANLVGTLEPGKRADIISLQANPLEERWAWHKIHLVMKDGERYDTLGWR